ncbi:MAG: hypothetical protein LBV45_11465 [Xanthomonadaceae bacterium]|nr:hypothetical protein [Xanthomonadaceae bacterium]
MNEEVCGLAKNFARGLRSRIDLLPMKIDGACREPSAPFRMRPLTLDGMHRMGDRYANRAVKMTMPFGKSIGRVNMVA